MNQTKDTYMVSVSQDPNNPDFAANPYPFYSRCRALADIVFWEEMGMPVATTHVASTSVLRSSKMGRKVPVEKRLPMIAGLEEFGRLEKYSLLELEPPEHTRLRRISMEGFGRERLAPLAPRVSCISDDLIDSFPDTEFDLIEAFTKPLPCIVIAEFLGVPVDLAGQLQSWSNDMVAMYQTRRDSEIEKAAARAAREFSGFIADFVKHRRNNPGAAFIDDLITATSAGEMTSDELMSTVVLLLNAGHEATVHALGNAIALLYSFPDRAIALSPQQIANTVEECLRYAPPLHLFTRHVYEPVEIEGISLDPGQEIACLLGSACRDDSVWPDAEKFDPFRLRRSHLAFGSGIHVCIGASLARLEMQIALPALFSRCPDLRIMETQQIANRYHFHGFGRMMVRVR